MWASTVLASNNALALVIYTGDDTRSAMNSNKATSKFGVCDTELN
jgi:phospholipid-translocating ATPase